MPANERRTAPRKNCVIPLRFRIVNDTSIIDVLDGETVNVSENGLFFNADQKLKIGDPIEMFFTMPRELTGRKPEPIRCKARIVRICPTGNNGNQGFGVAIERFELTSSPYRWDN